MPARPGRREPTVSREVKHATGESPALAKKKAPSGERGAKSLSSMRMAFWERGQTVDWHRLITGLLPPPHPLDLLRRHGLGHGEDGLEGGLCGPTGTVIGSARG